MPGTFSNLALLLHRGRVHPDPDRLLHGWRVDPDRDQRSTLTSMARWVGSSRRLFLRETLRVVMPSWAGASRRLFFQAAVQTIDFEVFDEIRQRHADVGYMRKYLDLSFYLNRAYAQTVRLGLDRSTPLSILDVGCGPCYFLYACNHLGHRTLGLDLPGMPFLDDMAVLLGVKKINHAVLPQQPLPDLGRFDLITGFSVAFDKKTTNGGRFRFDLDDWDFVLRDLRARLNPSGKIYLRLNATPGAKGLKLEDPELERLVERMGGTLKAKGRLLTLGAA